MRRHATPIGWPRRDPQHYRFAVPNAVREYKLKPIEFVIFSYLCYHSTPGVLTPEMIATDVHMTADTAQKYIDSIVTKKLVSKDGAPALKCEDTKFFTLPNEVFCCGFRPLRFWSTLTCC